MMEDRYLFRGKRTDNGEWVIGNLFRGEFIIPYTPVDKLGGYFAFHGFEFQLHKIDPATLGQCAGIKDSVGKLIFEKDIVRLINRFFDETATYEVIWDGYRFNCKNFYERYFDSPDDAFSEGMFEILGNVIDNEGLLEVSNDN